MATRPPRRTFVEERPALILLPTRRREIRRSRPGTEYRRESPRSEGHGRGPHLSLLVRHFPMPATGFAVPARTEDTSAPGARRAVESGPSGLPPRRWSNRGNRAPDTPASAGCCTESRPGARGSRIGPPTRDARSQPPAPRARTTWRSAPSRCGPFRRSVGHGGRRASRNLRLLTYRTVDGGARDDRSTSDAVLPGGRRGDRARARRRRVDCRSARVHQERRRGAAGAGEDGRHRSRAPEGWGGRNWRWEARLRERVSALRAEKGALVRNLPAVEAHRHVRDKIYAVYHRPSSR